MFPVVLQGTFYNTYYDLYVHSITPRCYRKIYNNNKLFSFSSLKDKLADFKKEQRKLDSRIINDHRLVSSVFQAEYPYYSRYISRRGLIDPYGQSYGRPRPYPSARAFEEAFKEAF